MQLAYAIKENSLSEVFRISLPYIISNFHFSLVLRKEHEHNSFGKLVVSGGK